MRSTGMFERCLKLYQLSTILQILGTIWQEFCIYFGLVRNALEKLKYPINTVLLLIVLGTGCGIEDLQGPTNTSDAPTHLVAIAISRSEVELSWKDNSAVEDGFIIERRPGYQGSYYEIARTGVNSTSYLDDKSPYLKPDTTYYYRVAYYNGNELSDYSNASSTTTLKKALALNKSFDVLTSQGDIFDNHNGDEDSVTGIEDERVQTEKDIPWGKIVVLSTLFYGDNTETGLQVIPELTETQIEELKRIVSYAQNSLQLPGQTSTEPDINRETIEIILSADQKLMELLNTDQYTAFIKWAEEFSFLPQISTPPPE